MNVYSLIIHGRVAGNWDAQSYDQRSKRKSQIIKQNSPRIVHSWTVPVVLDQPWNVLVGGGGVKTLPFCLVTTCNSMEDIGNSWLLC